MPLRLVSRQRAYPLEPFGYGPLEQGYLVRSWFRAVCAFQTLSAALYFLVRAALVALFSATQ